MLPIYKETDSGITIYQEKSRHISPHLHDAVEFVYVTKGSLALGVGQELHEMKQGDFAVVFPGLVHHYQVFEKGNNRACQILASPKHTALYREELTNLCPKAPVLLKDTLHPDIPYAIRTLCEEFGEGSTGKEADPLISAYVHILLARSLPAYELVDKRIVGSEDLIYRTVSYISAHFRDPLSLVSVARDLNVSEFVLSRVFSGTFHRNFNQYLNEKRLDYACALLHYTDRPVTEICFASGFESQRTFNRCFKENLHCSPREYRGMLGDTE